MRSNVISSAIWLALAIVSSILLAVGIITNSGLILFSSLFVFLIVFGLTYYIMNSYLVFRKFKYYDLSVKSNYLQIIFPFLIYFLNKDLHKEKLRYYDLLKFVSIIYPLIISFLLTGIITGTQLLFLSSVGENFNAALFIIGVITLMLVGWGFFILFAIFILKFFIRLGGSKFYANNKSILRKTLETLFLFYYFPKFYFEDLYKYKNQKFGLQQT